MYLSFWLDTDILTIRIKLWKVWDHWLHPCTCHSPWHHLSGCKFQGFTQLIRVKLKWRFSFPETNTSGKQEDKSMNLPHRRNSRGLLQSVCILLLPVSCQEFAIARAEFFIFGDTNEQVTGRPAAIFYYNEMLLLHVVRTQLLMPPPPPLSRRRKIIWYDTYF